MKKLLRVRVKIQSKKEYVNLVDGIYYVYTNSPARDNLANISVIELLSKYLDIPKSYISIKKGLKSKNKVVEIYV